MAKKKSGKKAKTKKKAAAKKSRSVAKKKTTKKPAAKKAAKKSPARKPVAKKAPARKAVAKKTASKKPAGRAKPQATVRAKKSVAKKAVAATVAKNAAVTKSVKPLAPAAPAPPPPPAKGSFVWHELMTTDSARCGDFYQGLFNWSRNEMEMIPGVTYTIFRNAGKDNAGMMTMAGPDWEGQPPRWIPYVKVKDVEAATMKAAQLGGRVVVPTSEIPMGQFAVIADPAGATIGVFTPHEA